MQNRSDVWIAGVVGGLCILVLGYVTWDGLRDWHLEHPVEPIPDGVYTTSWDTMPSTTGVLHVHRGVLFHYYPHSKIQAWIPDDDRQPILTRHEPLGPEDPFYNYEGVQVKTTIVTRQYSEPETEYRLDIGTPDRPSYGYVNRTPVRTK